LAKVLSEGKPFKEIEDGKVNIEGLQQLTKQQLVRRIAFVLSIVGISREIHVAMELLREGVDIRLLMEKMEESELAEKNPI
jgi:hypothetical protein